LPSRLSHRVSRSSISHLAQASFMNMVAASQRRTVLASKGSKHTAHSLGSVDDFPVVDGSIEDEK
jgi:hypothetical protein